MEKIDYKWIETFILNCYGIIKLCNGAKNEECKRT